MALKGFIKALEGCFKAILEYFPGSASMTLRQCCSNVRMALESFQSSSFLDYSHVDLAKPSYFTLL